ncbi:hypothetical protein TNCV_4911121 [Trichonephila clavipes]|nr:hypothetical protein TNCV_4911121 [Trichonephila clavipes]
MKPKPKPVLRKLQISEKKFVMISEIGGKLHNDMGHKKMQKKNSVHLRFIITPSHVPIAFTTINKRSVLFIVSCLLDFTIDNACVQQFTKINLVAQQPIRVKANCALLSIREHWALSCQVIYSQFGLAIHPNDHQARRRFVEWAQNEIAVVPDFHKRILFSDEAHFWLNGYVNKQNCRIWREAIPQVYVETPLHPEKLTVWCAIWAGGILLQKR